MQKYFKIETNMGIAFMPANNAIEALAKLIRAEPSILVLGSAPIKEATDLEVAELEIMDYIHDLSAMGANDYEFPAIDGILIRMRAGKIKPNEAVELVRKIRHSKHDYH